MKKIAIAAMLGLGVAAGAAQARDVYWSVGIHVPVHPNVSVGVSNYEPVYRPAPVVYAPPPVVVVPAPVYMPRPRVVYAPPPVYVPQRVVYAPAWVPPGHSKRYWKAHKRHHHERWHDDD